MNKTTVYGLPLNPMPLLNELRGASFCVSYGTRDKLGKQLDQAIELVGQDGILLVDNGAFTKWKAGKGAFTAAEIEDFGAWARDILDRCPQAIAVIPDVIGGTEAQNAKLVEEYCTLFDNIDRAMPIWHMHESIEYLLYLCEGFGYVGIGSSGDFRTPGTAAWKARLDFALAAIDQWVEDSDGAYLRPRIHLMRAQQFAHAYAVDSSDSTNVAVNHNRQLEKSGETIVAFAARIDGKIQASAGPEAEWQVKRPLLGHVEHTAWERAFLMEMAELDARRAVEPAEVELAIAA